MRLQRLPGALKATRRLSLLTRTRTFSCCGSDLHGLKSQKFVYLDDRLVTAAQREGFPVRDQLRL